jgi:hypothetical protein
MHRRCAVYCFTVRDRQQISENGFSNERAFLPGSRNRRIETRGERNCSGSEIERVTLHHGRGIRCAGDDSNADVDNDTIRVSGGLAYE